MRLSIELVCDRVHGMAAGESTGQLQELRELVEGLCLPVHADAIVAARAALDAFTAKVVEAEAEYARTQQAVVDGYPDTAAFLRHRCGMTVQASRVHAKEARRLAGWPELGEAWRAGVLTGTQVSLICRLVPDRHVERFATTLADTIEILAPLTATQTSRVVSRWVSHADDAAQREAAEDGRSEVPPETDRELSAARGLDHELVVNGHFDPDSAAIVEQALVAATRPDPPGETRSPARRRADAWVEVARTYLETLDDDGSNRRREHLTVVADVRTLFGGWLSGAGVRTADDLADFLADHPDLGPLERGLFTQAFDGDTPPATTLAGAPVTEALVAAAASGGVLELLLTAEGRPLHLGRSVRTFSAAQRKAMLALWKGCATCGAPPHLTHLHHVEPWDAGGCTDIANGMPKCGFCHLDHHAKGWTDRIEPDGTYVLSLPDGSERRYRPPGHDDQLPLLPVASTSRPARPLVRERDLVHQWSAYDEPEVTDLHREVVLARLRLGDGHADTEALKQRLDELIEKLELAA
jgi:phage terminase Nu1 subunit (DNA packaging protein)